MTKKRHDCKICQLARTFTKIAKKCTKKEIEALTYVWSAMEASETEMDWLKGKAKDGEPIYLGKIKYYPENKGVSKIIRNLKDCGIVK